MFSPNGGMSDRCSVIAFVLSRLESKPALTSSECIFQAVINDRGTMSKAETELFNWNTNAHFPEVSEEAIPRTHQLHAIIDALSAAVPIIFLEGEALDGATWALAQFCLLKPEQTFSLFITPASKLTYSVDYLRLVLAEQFNMCLNSTGLQGETITRSEYDSLRVRLLRRFKTTPIYFVLDGLHQIPEEDTAVISQIFSELLPMGFPQCRFIITGREQQFKQFLHKTQSKYFALHRFNLSETKQFLKVFVSSESDCERIYSLCRNGSPGLLAVVKRLLQNGADLEDLLRHRPEKYLDFVRLEFESLSGMPPQQQLLLANLAFAKVQQSKTDLSEMAGVPTEEIDALVSNCSFLKTTETGRIEYVSETHRTLASKMLERYRNQAHEQQLKLLESRPNSDMALRFMPVYLETLNRKEALFDLLSRNEHYGSLLERTQSFTALRTQAALAAKAALEMQRVNEVFRFSLQRSIFFSAGSAAGDSSRVRALVALGKTDAALALASTEKTKEDRLALLCTYARLFTERHGKPELPLLEYISKLIADVDFSEMGDHAMQIAADVLMFDADAAIGIIESAVKGEALAVRDAAFAQLSMSASLRRSSAKGDDKVRSQITDESLQKIAHSFELLARRLDTSSLKSLMVKMPAEHQIHFLRTFVSIKRNESNILDLVDLGIDTIIREPSYIPRARDLADLCAPFIHEIADKERLKALIDRVDSQVGLVAKTAQSRDLTLLQMRLANGQYQFDRPGARERITAAYYATMDVKTPEVRLECLAVMLGAVGRLDADGELEAKDGLREVIKKDLDEVVDVMLAGAGDHLAAVLPVLKVLAADDCVAALRLAERLNVQARRESAYENVARIIATQPFSADRLIALKAALSNIHAVDHRSRATVALLGSLDTNADKCAWLKSLDGLRDYCLRGFQLSAWDCWMFKESASCGVAYEVELFIERTNEAIARNASVIEEAKLHFNAAEVLAKSAPDKAQRFYADGLRVSQSHPLATQSRSRLFELCLSLVGRSMASLARCQMLKEEDINRYLVLVGGLPGLVARVRVLAEFAERLWCARRSDLLERVVNQSLRPQLAEARSAHRSIGRLTLRIAFPSLCAAHQKHALEWAEELQRDAADADADAAMHATALLKVRHLALQDPEVGSKSDYSKMRSEDVLDVIELIGRMSVDSTIYNTVRLLVDAITDSRNKNKFTTTQKADWASRLISIVEQRLPDPKNIQHRGYVLVCKAAIFSLVDTSWSQWDGLIAQVTDVPNIADRAFILTALAVALPKKFASHRKNLLERATKEIDSIPSPLDRLSHMQGYAEEVHAADATASVKETLKAAMKLSLKLDEVARVSRHRRELIDLADQIDPALANELVEMVDDDPARVELKREAKRVSQLGKTKRALANATTSDEADECDLDLLPPAAWKNLGALLANRLESKPTDVMLQVVNKVAGGTLDQAYPVLCWHLANLERKYVQAQDIRTHLVPHCESVLLATELTASLLRRLSGSPPDVVEEPGDDGMVVRRRSRQEAVAFLQSWLQQNAADEIIICDPYFETKDIALLRICLATAPGSSVRVLASKNHLESKGELAAEAFQVAWKEQSDQEPPETEVIACAYTEEKTKQVIHDRWLLTGDAGLRLGTSFNSLGENKLSEISVLDVGRVRDLNNQLGRYLKRQRVVDGAKVQYVTFTL